MENNYSFRLTVSVIAALVSASSYGQSYTQCRTVDFAELQTFNKDELAALYCKNNRTIKAAQNQAATTSQAAVKMSELGPQYARIGDRKGAADAIAQAQKYLDDASKLGENATACTAENERVVRSLTSKNTVVQNCDPLTLANIKEPPAPPVTPTDPLTNDYCQAVSDIKQQLDTGNSFLKETARLNSVKEKMKKNKIPLPTDCH